MDNIYVAISCDEKYSILGATMLFSASQHLSDGKTLHIYIIDNGISKNSKDRFVRVLNLPNIFLNWITTASDYLPELPTSSWVSNAGNMRVMLPEILPSEADRVLYLDCDMIVKHDLSKLWDINIENSTLYACVDATYSTVSKCKASEALKNCGLAPGTPYFNSGLLLMNKRRWLKKNIKSKYIDLLQSNRSNFTHLNQDTLNVVLKGDWQILDPAWNVINLNEFISQNKEEPRILHFAGEKLHNPFSHHLKKKEFYFYLQKSKWFTPYEYYNWALKNSVQYLINSFKNLNGKFGIRTKIKNILSNF